MVRGGNYCFRVWRMSLFTVRLTGEQWYWFTDSLCSDRTFPDRGWVSRKVRHHFSENPVSVPTCALYHADYFNAILYIHCNTGLNTRKWHKKSFYEDKTIKCLGCEFKLCCALCPIIFTGTCFIYMIVFSTKQGICVFVTLNKATFQKLESTVKMRSQKTR